MSIEHGAWGMEGAWRSAGRGRRVSAMGGLKSREMGQNIGTF